MTEAEQVPVEVPVEVMQAAQLAAQAAALDYDNTWPDIVRHAVEAAYPLIAARVRAEADASEEQVISERDEYHEWADRLAAAIGGDAIGEHSSANNPWQNALDLAADHDARVRAEERQWAAAVASRRLHALGEHALADAVHESIMAAGSAVPVATPQRPEIVVLCGSTRFKDAFREAAKSEALAGRIVLTVSDLDPRPEMRHVNVPIDAETKARLDQLHRHKIDLAGRVLVLNVGGYIGESTRAEIDYAAAHGKPITYLESPAPTTTCPHGLTMPHEDSSFVTGVTSTCPGPVATPTEPAQDYRLCSGGFRAADGQAVPCEHDEIGPHRPPNEQDGQR